MKKMMVAVPQMSKEVAYAEMQTTDSMSGSRDATKSRGGRLRLPLARAFGAGLFVLAALVLAPNCVAQHTSDSGKAQHTSDPQHTADPGKGHSEGEPMFEVFGGYSYLREEGENLHGWTGTFIVNVNHWFAIAADFDGHYGSFTDEFGKVRVREHGFTFGPHVALHNHTRVTPFAFALFGGAHESVKFDGDTESATGFAANLGGGLDVHVNERVSVRLIQVDAAYTRFEGHGSTSPRISAGLVFHFGKKK